MKKKAFLALILALTLLAGISSSALTGGPITTEPLIPPTTNPYEYATAPDGFYVFIYRGCCPYFTGELDTSECTEGLLYVHDQEADEIIQIANQNVVGFAASKDALYYLTEDSKVHKSDYTGSTQSLLYQYEDGDLRDLSVYLGVLMMVMDENSLLFVDASTGASHTVFSGDTIDWYFMLSDTTILIATLDGQNLVYDLTLRQVTEDVSEMEANNMINIAVLGAAGQTDPDASVMATISAPPATVQNDVALPLPEYPANIYPSSEIQDFDYVQPLSWFHVNGLEGCSASNCKTYYGAGECEGFAMYAHDRYLHQQNSFSSYATWKSTQHLEHRDQDFSYGDSTGWLNFFRTLNTGDYIRYGKDDQTAGEEGAHSVVFHSVDASLNGIWVYECNQAYDAVGTGTHGCAVSFRYYTLYRISRNYDFLAFYIRHEYDDTVSILNDFEHGYVCNGADVQSTMKSEEDYVAGQTHYRSCKGYLVTGNHTRPCTYTPKNALGHLVRAGCCSGSVLVPHTIIGNSCLECGYISN